MRVPIIRDSLSNQIVSRGVITHSFEPGAPIESWNQGVYDEGVALMQRLDDIAGQVTGQAEKPGARQGAVYNGTLERNGQFDHVNARYGLGADGKPAWLDGEAHPAAYPSFRQEYKIGTSRCEGQTVKVYQQDQGLYSTTQAVKFPSGKLVVVQTYGDGPSS